jgi:alpha-mannosidase
VEIADRPAHALVLDDPGDTWGHGLDRFGPVAGGFVPQDVRVVVPGPVRGVVRVVSAFGDSTLTEDIVVSAGSRIVEVLATLDWRAQRQVLKLRSSAVLRDTLATFSVPYGHVERAASGREEPGQDWVDVTGATPSGTRAGVAVVCDTKGAWDVDGGSIGITAARSPAFAWHDPQPIDPDRAVSFQDQGRQRFRYGLLPHDGSWRRAGVPSAAAAFRAPPVTLLEGTHPGSLPPSGSFASVEPRAVELTALKLAEDGSGDLIVRLAEGHGSHAIAVVDLRLVGRRHQVVMRGHEIRTLRVPRHPGQPIRSVDLLES